jgi:hypothetical protein
MATSLSHGNPRGDTGRMLSAAVSERREFRGMAGASGVLREQNVLSRMAVLDSVDMTLLMYHHPCL